MGAAKDLAGTHVLLPGGARGLALEMAQEFARAGASLTLVARGREALEKAVADVGGRALPADLANESDVEGLVQRAEELAHAPVDVLVLNAGIDSSGDFADLTAEQLRQLWLVNVIAPTELIRQARPLMAARCWGHIGAVSYLLAQVTV